jgi:hypothetical protein
MQLLARGLDLGTTLLTVVLFNQSLLYLDPRKKRWYFLCRSLNMIASSILWQEATQCNLRIFLWSGWVKPQNIFLKISSTEPYSTPFSTNVPLSVFTIWAMSTHQAYKHFTLSHILQITKYVYMVAILAHSLCYWLYIFNSWMLTFVISDRLNWQERQKITSDTKCYQNISVVLWMF